MTTSNWPRQIIAFIRLGRFVFLSGGFILYGLGAAIAHYTGAEIHWQKYIWGQVIVTLTQLMTHYSNDYFDFEADAANLSPTRWSGGSRVLPTGELNPIVSRNAAIILLIVATSLSILLATIEKVGTLTLPILLLAIGLSWSYSSPPLRLNSHGLGEIAAIMILSVLTPILGFYLQVGEIQKIVLLPLPTLALLQFNMVLSVHLPDVEGDQLVNKRTLVVILGSPATCPLYLVCLFSAYAFLPIMGIAGLSLLVMGAGFLTLPVAGWQVWQIWQGGWFKAEKWENIAFLSIILLMGTAILEIFAFLWLSLD